MFSKPLQFDGRRRLAKWLIFGCLSPIVGIAAWIVTSRLGDTVHGVSRVSAQTELIAYTVINPNLVNIPIRGVRVTSGSPQVEGKCINGWITPVLNARVTYGRPGWAPLSVSIESTRQMDASTVALFTAYGQNQRIALSNPVGLISDPTCKLKDKDDEHIDLSKTPVPFNLPVFGRATIGSESHPFGGDDPEPGTLLTAKVTVSARSSIISKGELYPVSTFDIPVGSRIDARLDTGALRDADANAAQQDREAGANWAGVAFLDTEKPGLSVEVETDTTTLRITRPNSTIPEIVKVTGVKEFFEDPGLIIVYKVAFVLVLLFTFSTWLHETFIEEGPEAKQLKVLEEIKACLKRID